MIWRPADLIAFAPIFGGNAMGLKSVDDMFVYLVLPEKLVTVECHWELTR